MKKEQKQNKKVKKEDGKLAANKKQHKEKKDFPKRQKEVAYQPVKMR